MRINRIPSILAAGLVTLAGIGFPFPSLADGVETNPPQGWGVGLAVTPEQKAYRGFNQKTSVWPLVTYENRWVRIAGPGLDVKLGSTGSVSYALAVTYANEGYQASDSPFLAGMSERKSSLWAGGRATWSADIANFSVSWLGDASDNSRGQKFTAGAERRFQINKLGLTPRVVANWLDSRYIDYYYGVTAGETRAGRNPYDGNATVNTELGLRLDYRLTPAQIVFLDLGVTSLGSGIKDSPLVDRNSLSEARLGYIYRF